jgi:hypothetical protein
MLKAKHTIMVMRRVKGMNVSWRKWETA